MASPNILYYSVLKGIVKFTPDGGAETDLGNAPEFELTPAVDKLDHFSSRAGVRSKDRSVAREKNLTVRIVLDEMSPFNWRMALLGSASTTNSAGNSTFGLFAESEINGSLTFTGTNDIGSQINLTLPNVSFLPSGSISFISEEWGSMELTGDVLFDEGAGDFGTVEIVEPEGVTA
jgi:hypothetical protein